MTVNTDAAAAVGRAIYNEKIRNLVEPTRKPTMVLIDVSSAAEPTWARPSPPPTRTRATGRHGQHAGHGKPDQRERGAHGAGRLAIQEPRRQGGRGDQPDPAGGGPEQRRRRALRVPVVAPEPRPELHGPGHQRVELRRNHAHAVWNARRGGGVEAQLRPPPSRMPTAAWTTSSQHAPTCKCQGRSKAECRRPRSRTPACPDCPASRGCWRFRILNVVNTPTAWLDE